MTPLDRLRRSRSGANSSEKLYGAIVAQARLPVFYRKFGVPDTLKGRFTLLALHLFVLLHRLGGKESESGALPQELMDSFSQDMETVLRELGVSDLRVPKSMRRVAAASQGLFQGYETAVAMGEQPFRQAITAALPDETEDVELSSSALASYLVESMRALERQDVELLRLGRVDFPKVDIEP